MYLAVFLLLHIEAELLRIFFPTESGNPWEDKLPIWSPRGPSICWSGGTSLPRTPTAGRVVTLPPCALLLEFSKVDGSFITSRATFPHFPPLFALFPLHFLQLQISLVGILRMIHHLKIGFMSGKVCSASSKCVWFLDGFFCFI